MSVSRLTFLQDDVVAARPDIDQRVEQLVSKGRWQVPGYQVSAFRNSSSLQLRLTHETGEIRQPLRTISEPSRCCLIESTVYMRTELLCPEIVLHPFFATLATLSLQQRRTFSGPFLDRS